MSDTRSFFFFFFFSSFISLTSIVTVDVFESTLQTIQVVEGCRSVGWDVPFMSSETDFSLAENLPMAPTVENFKSREEASEGDTQARRLALLELWTLCVLLTLSGIPVFQVGGGPAAASGALVGVFSFLGEDFILGDESLAGEFCVFALEGVVGFEEEAGSFFTTNASISVKEEE